MARQIDNRFLVIVNRLMMDREIADHRFRVIPDDDPKHSFMAEFIVVLRPTGWFARKVLGRKVVFPFELKLRRQYKADRAPLVDMHIRHPKTSAIIYRSSFVIPTESGGGLGHLPQKKEGGGFTHDPVIDAVDSLLKYDAIRGLVRIYDRYCN